MIGSNTSIWGNLLERLRGNWSPRNWSNEHFGADISLISIPWARVAVEAPSDVTLGGRVWGTYSGSGICFCFCFCFIGIIKYTLPTFFHRRFDVVYLLTEFSYFIQLSICIPVHLQTRHTEMIKAMDIEIQGVLKNKFPRHFPTTKFALDRNFRISNPHLRIQRIYVGDSCDSPFSAGFSCFKISSSLFVSLAGDQSPPPTPLHLQTHPKKTPPVRWTNRNMQRYACSTQCPLDL